MQIAASARRSRWQLPRVALLLLPTSIHLWPDEWPLFAQVGLGPHPSPNLGSMSRNRVAHEISPLAISRVASQCRALVGHHRSGFISSICSQDRFQPDPSLSAWCSLPVFLWIGAVTAFRSSDPLQSRRQDRAAGLGAEHAAPASLASLEAACGGKYQLR